MSGFVRQFVNQIKIRKWNFLQEAGIILGVSIFGMVLVQIIMRVAAEDGDDVFYMGSFLSVMALLMIMLFFAGIVETNYFGCGISMGCNRRGYWSALTLRLWLLYICLQVEIVLMQHVESWILRLTFPDNPVDSWGGGVLQWSYILPLALAGVGVSLLNTASMVKYGKKAYIAWYVLYVAACLGVPRLVHWLNVIDNSLYDRVVDALASHMDLAPWILGLAVAVIGYADSWLMIRKQQVNI
jgi:hypothetical protein